MTIMSSRRYWRSSTNSGATPVLVMDGIPGLIRRSGEPDDWLRDQRGFDCRQRRDQSESVTTITHFTPCDTVRAVTKRMGFKDLRSQLKILLPLGIVRKTRASEESALISDESIIEERLTKYDRKILLDHRPYRVGHLLVGEGDEYCYLLYTHVVRHRLPYCHIQFISNKDLFAKKERVVRGWLLRNHKARFVAVDARLVSDMSFRRSFNFWAPGYGLYKSSDVAPEQIDNLLFRRRVHEADLSSDCEA